jgi:hypothetical protein
MNGTRIWAWRKTTKAQTNKIIIIGILSKKWKTINNLQKCRLPFLGSKQKFRTHLLKRKRKWWFYGWWIRAIQGYIYENTKSTLYTFFHSFKTFELTLCVCWWCTFLMNWKTENTDNQLCLFFFLFFFAHHHPSPGQSAFAIHYFFVPTRTCGSLVTKM